ncbi:MAG TPA: DUF5916 domain-containing protein [Vicinamibacteria bacterium]|nr:DUF5916 domain-containing protein [Vicinamibacteria bacterium]
MRGRAARALLTGLCVVLPAPLQAADAPVALASPAVGPVTLDGRLDEAAWAGAPPIGALVQTEPDEGASPTEATEVRVLRDDETLYFGVRCFDSTPSGIAATKMGRDGELEGDDHVMVVLETFGDRRNGFFFAVNPRGARAEGQIANNSEELNFDWDGIWDAAARVDDGGWTAELAIPFKTLRFRKEISAWGLNVQRYVARRQETDRWTAARRDVWISNLSEAGRLEGLQGARQGRGLDVRPYLSGGEEDGGGEVKVGGDVFKNLTSNLTASLTINTDFAETEADDRQVNLTRFPLFYPEKRSFFLEGAGIYEVASLGSQNSDLVPFYSRRIGLYQGEEVPILAGLKLSGRVERWNVGLLDVETSRVDDLGLDRQNLLAARVSRNLFRQSFVGALVTHGNPSGDGTNTLAGVDARFATSTFRGGENLSLDLYAFVTDDEASRGKGHAWGGKLDYPNDLWDVALTFKEIDADFRPALGFVSRTGIRKTNAKVDFMPRPRRLGIRQLFLEASLQYVTDTSGRMLDWMVIASPVGFQTESGDGFRFEWVPQFERLDEPFEIQPGIVIPPGDYPYTAWIAEVETAARRRWVGEVEVRWGSFYEGELTRLEARLALKPSARFLVGLEGEWSEGELPDGRFTAKALAGSLDVNFNPNLGWSNLVQYDSDSRELGFQSRLRWRLRPGSDLFVVFNRGWVHEEGGTYRPYFDRGSAKVQHTFRF